MLTDHLFYLGPPESFANHLNSYASAVPLNFEAEGREFNQEPGLSAVAQRAKEATNHEPGTTNREAPAGQ